MTSFDVHLPFDTVVIAGGTHGNERTGVTLVQHWRQSPHAVRRAGFETRFLLANPEAIRANRRFIDCDLNRSFLPGNKGAGYEIGRAGEIAAWMRKVGRRTFAVDLHTTTTRMGVTLITNTDPVNLAIAAEVQNGLKNARIYCFAAGERIDSCLRAAADGGIGVEIGPIAQGVVRQDVLETTQAVVQRVLDALEAWNRVGLGKPEGRRTVYLHDRHVYYPEGDPDAPPPFVHRDLEGRDYRPLRTGQAIFQDLGGRTWFYEAPGTRYPVFINEAAYYHENIAFSLTRRISLASLEGFRYPERP